MRASLSCGIWTLVCTCNLSPRPCPLACRARGHGARACIAFNRRLTGEQEQETMQHEHLVGSASGHDQTLVYAAPAEDQTLKIMVHSGEQETTQYEHLVGSAGGDDQTLEYAAAPAEDQTLKYLGGDGDRTLAANSQAEGFHEGGPSWRPAKERVSKKRIVLESDEEDVATESEEAVAETVQGQEDGAGSPVTSSNDAELQPIRKRRNVRANVPLADALTIGHLFASCADSHRL